MAIAAEAVKELEERVSECDGRIEDGQIVFGNVEDRNTFRDKYPDSYALACASYAIVIASD